MTYWTGLPPEKQKKYMEEFKNSPLTDESFNPFKTVQCSADKCGQYIALKLIRDSLSNSMHLVYAGACINGHWNQRLPSTPADMKEPPQCRECGSFMQYVMSLKFNGFVCLQEHNLAGFKVFISDAVLPGEILVVQPASLLKEGPLKNAVEKLEKKPCPEGEAVCVFPRCYKSKRCEGW